MYYGYGFIVTHLCKCVHACTNKYTSKNLKTLKIQPKQTQLMVT